MNELALFAGSGGGLLASELLGWTTVCAVEIDPYCRSILVRRQNERNLRAFPIWDDVRTFDGNEWRGAVDLVSSGFPCQRHSTIGNLHGSDHFDGWPQTRRIISEVLPRVVWLENVPGLLGSGFRSILDELSWMGYDARWGVFSCRDAASNAPQFGKRLFCMATTSSNRLEKERPSLAERAKIWKPIMPAAAISAAWAQGIPEPTIQFIPDGLAGYVGELKAIGQGQVPAVVRLAWETLKP